MYKNDDGNWTCQFCGYNSKGWFHLVLNISQIKVGGGTGEYFIPKRNYFSHVN